MSVSENKEAGSKSDNNRTSGIIKSISSPKPIKNSVQTRTNQYVA